MRRGWMLALACVVLLAGCGGTDRGAQAAFAPEEVQTLAGSGAFSDQLEEVDAALVFQLYHLDTQGLTAEQLEDCGVRRSAGATCEEVAILVLDSAGSAEQAVAALETYVSDQIELNRSYRPDEVTKLESAVLEQRGETVLFAVAAQPDVLKEALS